MSGALTLLTSDGSPLAKRWALVDGRLQKTTAAKFYRGRYNVERFDSVADLAALLSRVSTSQAISASTPTDGSECGGIVTQKAHAANPECITRGKRDFKLSGPGVGVIDCDESGISRDDLWAMLLECAPGLAQAGVIWRPSGSSHVHHGSDDLTGLSGQHLFVLVSDVADWPRVLKVLFARLWLAGRGSVKIGKAGQLLPRCPVDTAVGDVGRLIFAGGSICEPPLEQRRGHAVVLSDGGFLDTAGAVAPLSAEETGRFEALMSKAKAEAGPEAMTRKRAYKAEEVGARMPDFMARGMSAAEAEAVVGELVDAALSGTLLGDFLLTLVHDDGRHEVVSVQQVLSDPDRYHECDCLDPLNPEHRDGAADARLFLQSSSPIVYSLDDGGQVYRLRRQKVRLVYAGGRRDELVSQLVAVVVANESVFTTDAGPVLVNGGRVVPLTQMHLVNLIGREVALFRVGSGGRETPADLPREFADYVRAELTKCGGAAA